MKKTLKRFTYALFAIIVVIACTKEIEVEDNFAFDFNIIKQDNANINVANSWFVYITPERVVNSIDYYFSYEIIEGSGYFETPASGLGAIHQIEEGEESLITCLDCFYFNYKGNVPGLHKIRVFVRNSKGLVITHDYNITISYQPFVFNFALGTANFYINTPLDVSVTLLNGSTDGTEVYDFSYTVSGGTGLLYRNNVLLNTSTNHVFARGLTNLKYLPTTIGEHIITAKGTALDGNMIERTLTVNVTNVPFSFTAVPTSSNIYINEKTPITYNLMQLISDGSPLTGQYTFVYNGSDGNGVLSYPTGTVITPGSPINVNSGSWFFNYMPTTLGTHSLSFTVTDNSFVPQSVTVNMSLNASHVPVNYNVSSLPTSYINQAVNVNHVVTPQVTTIATYELNYVLLEGQGVLSNGSTEITPGTYFSVSTGNFSHSYRPTISGTHRLQFFLRDSNGQIITKEITIQATTNSFTFLPTASSTVYVNQNNVFNFALVPSGVVTPGTSYTMTYNVQSNNIGTFNNGSTIYNQGIPIEVSPNSYQLNYKPTTIGTHVINYTILDSNGTSVPYQQTVNVIASDFNFIAQQSNTTIYKNTLDQIALSISSSIGAPNLSYNLSYNIVGVGGLFYSNNTPVPSGTVISAGNHNIFFKSNTAGSSTINLSVTDSNGTIRTATLNYVVQNVGFSLSTSGDGSLILNNLKDFYIYLSQSSPDPSTLYEVRFIIGNGSTGSGEVYQNGNLLTLGTYYPISIGSSLHRFKGTASGVVNLRVEVKDSYGVTNTSTVIFNISGIAFVFSGAADDTTLYVGESTPLNFDISETAASGTNYEMKYVFTQGTGSVLNGSNIMNSGVWYPVNIGAFSRAFSATESGQTKVLFTARNSVTLVEQTQLITINTSNSNYTFTANNVTNNQTVGSSIPINLLINQLGTAPTTYSMVFTTTGTGSFVYNGTTYTAGQPIPIIVGSSSGNYVGTTTGSHNLQFQVTNSNNPPVLKNTNISLIYTAPDFLMSTSGDGSLNINTEKEFNVFLAQLSPAPEISYQVRYIYASGTTGTGEIKNLSGSVYNLGVLYPISIGNTGMKYKALTYGVVKLRVEILDSNGIIHSSIIEFDNEISDYTFSAAAQENNISLGTSNNINFDISELLPTGTNYEMKHVVTQGNCIIKNGSSILNTGTWYSVPVGSFVRTFEPTQIGIIKVKFTSKNLSSGIEYEQLITINVTAADFTFTANQINNNVSIGSPINVNALLTQIGNSQTSYTMVFNTSNIGSYIIYNGQNYYPNEPITVVPGAFSLQYISASHGTHNVNYTITNSFGLEKTVNMQYTIILPNFTLATSGDGSILANELKPFFVSITPSAFTPANTTYSVKFTYSSSLTGEIYLNNNLIPSNTYIDINSGITEFAFRSTTHGNVTLNVEVKNNYNVVQNSNINFIIKNPRIDKYSKVNTFDYEGNGIIRYRLCFKDIEKDNLTISNLRITSPSPFGSFIVYQGNMPNSQIFEDVFLSNNNIIIDNTLFIRITYSDGSIINLQKVVDCNSNQNPFISFPLCAICN